MARRGRGRRSLRGGRGHRPRWHGRGAPGAPPRVGRRPRGEVPAVRPGPARGRAGAVPRRSGDVGVARLPPARVHLPLRAHGGRRPPGVRRVRARRQPPRVDRRRAAAPGRPAGGAGAAARPGRPAGLGARARAPPGPGAPGRQAGQRAPRRLRHRQDHRLRPGPGARGDRRAARREHPGARWRRHAAVRLAGAGGGPPRGAAHRRLQLRGVGAGGVHRRRHLGQRSGRRCGAGALPDRRWPDPVGGGRPAGRVPALGPRAATGVHGRHRRRPDRGLPGRRGGAAPAPGSPGGGAARRRVHQPRTVPRGPRPGRGR